jgi:hypothetical protein
MGGGTVRRLAASLGHDDDDFLCDHVLLHSFYGHDNVLPGSFVSIAAYDNPQQEQQRRAQYWFRHHPPPSPPLLRL